MLNYIVIQGRLSKDPELRYTRNQTAVATFSVAVHRDYDREKADFIDVIARRQTAEFVEKYFRKGQMIIVSGSLQMRKWKDKHGNRRISAEVNADNVYFCESKRSEGSHDNNDYGGENNSYSGSYMSGAARPVDVAYGGAFTEAEDDGELPF